MGRTLLLFVLFIVFMIVCLVWLILFVRTLARGVTHRHTHRGLSASHDVLPYYPCPTMRPVGHRCLFPYTLLTKERATKNVSRK